MVVGQCVAERAMRLGHGDVRYDERRDCHRKRIKTDAQNAAAAGGEGFSGVAGSGYASSAPVANEGRGRAGKRKGPGGFPRQPHHLARSSPSPAVP